MSFSAPTNLKIYNYRTAQFYYIGANAETLEDLHETFFFVFSAVKRAIFYFKNSYEKHSTSD